MKTPPFLSFSSYEGSIIWQFFESVSAAVSNRMLRGSPPGEENLSFLLGELLDESSTSLHVLDYSLASAKADLEKSDAGITVDVKIQTHEHSRWVEAKYSRADLGIVFVIDHPLLGHSRRAVLLQAKKLFPVGQANEFSINSEYDSYKPEQARFLQELQERFECWNSIFYLWYNPPSSGFPEGDGKLVRSYEAVSRSLWPFWLKGHPFMDELLEGLSFVSGGGALTHKPEDEERDRAWRLKQPGVRVSALSAVLAVTEGGQKPQLQLLYKALLENGMRRGVHFVFTPFADFFLLGLLSRRIGCSDENWLQLAEGKKVPMPALKDKSSSSGLLAQLDGPPIPRHTITLTLRSTLPNVG